MTELKTEYQAVMWAEMDPDIYSGENCDETLVVGVSDGKWRRFKQAIDAAAMAEGGEK